MVVTVTQYVNKKQLKSQGYIALYFKFYKHFQSSKLQNFYQYSYFEGMPGTMWIQHKNIERRMKSQIYAKA